MALAGIDMAVWDAFARAHELPLCALLGSAPRPIQAYAGVSYEGVLGSAESAEKWARKGFKAVKAKIGYPTVAEDRLATNCRTGPKYQNPEELGSSSLDEDDGRTSV